jgi:hypothetical protein
MSSPTPHTTACLELLTHGILLARTIARASPLAKGTHEERLAHLADLTTALHNVPKFADDEHGFNEWARPDLEECDTKWNNGVPHLVTVYESALRA